MTSDVLEEVKVGSPDVPDMDGLLILLEKDTGLNQDVSPVHTLLFETEEQCESEIVVIEESICRSVITFVRTSVEFLSSNVAHGSHAEQAELHVRESQLACKAVEARLVRASKATTRLDELRELQAVLIYFCRSLVAELDGSDSCRW